MTSNVWMTFDLNTEWEEALPVTSQYLLKVHKMLNFFRIFPKMSETLEAYISGTETNINKG